MAKVSQEIWEIAGKRIPVFIHAERRSNNRISITKRGVNIRIPAFGAKVMRKSYEAWARDWLHHQLTSRPDIAKRFEARKYRTGHQISTPYRDYLLEIEATNRKTSSANLAGDSIRISLNDQLNEWSAAKTIRTLAARIIGQDQRPRVEERIFELNDQFFQKEIKQVRMKNNSSNWGSCSNSGNINISIKTLLAPYVVQDYIFIHELAHRLEMNHSARYWAIVGNVMPSYKIHERWIKENGHLCEI